MPSELKVNKLSPYTGSTLTLGDSGDTITLASGVSLTGVNATFSGDLTVDTNTLYVDSANNSVGIGTTSPDGKLNVVGERIVTNAGAIGTNLSLGGRSIAITGVENLSSSGRAGFVNRIGNDFAVINDNAGFMHLYPFSDGDDSYAFRASVGTTLSDTFYVKQQGDAYFSGAINLGGTTSANALDDYEEGTWTPTVTSGTVSVNSANYTKIGRCVMYRCDVGLGGTRGGETFQIGGLPFTVASSSGWTAGSMYHQNSIGAYQQIVAVAKSNDTVVVFQRMGGDLIGTDFGGGYLNVGGFYFI